MDEEGVTFEVTLKVSVITPLLTTHLVLAHTLPEGLAIITCDDDVIPRLFANVLLTAASANMAESAVLGEQYSEVATLVELVLAKAKRLGDERVLCVLDQNLDGYGEQGYFMGTGLARELRRRGFNGLVIIQSANDEVPAATPFEPIHERTFAAMVSLPPLRWV